MSFEKYLRTLFEQEPLGVNKARELNPQLYSILKGIKVDLPTFNSFRTIVTSYQNNLRRCERLLDIEQKMCVCNTKIDLFRKESIILGRAERMCGVQRDPEGCRNKIRNRIDQNIEQIKKQQQRVISLRSESIAKKNKAVEDRRKQLQNIGKNIAREVPVER